MLAGIHLQTCRICLKDGCLCDMACPIGREQRDRTPHGLPIGQPKQLTRPANGAYAQAVERIAKARLLGIEICLSTRQPVGRCVESKVRRTHHLYSN